jgi:hypothetical protein
MLQQGLLTTTVFEKREGILFHRYHDPSFHGQLGSLRRFIKCQTLVNLYSGTVYMLGILGEM